ncbi:uncharacterized protein LOC122667399 [Telopea speciosissima]|uniref:uncharacterized protein LOC122667399 n=1 Tax=Telopea speciosissima TaxID=54955 RepID=UPI001CC40B23|nr:uncharacterized protein LOC122667399 [Telopea speciosissima]
MDCHLDGFVKFNVDVVSHGNLDSAGIGGVCRDHNSVFLCCFAKGIGWNYALVAKTLAIRRALVIAGSMGIKKLIIESDNMLVVNLLKDAKKAPPWRIASIIEDCRIYSQAFDCILYHHSLREANSVANCLASLGTNAQ